jgi:hypothetical protein
MRSITDNQQSGIGTWKSTLGNWRPSIAFAVVASFVVIVPAIIWGIPSNLDLTNHFRFALPFYDAIVAGDPYPGWLAESNGGYGDPSFRFYPPALYYLLAAARFVIGNWYGATLVVFVMVSVTGALGMYFWSRSILSPSSASWAAFFYAIAPYHLNQLYQATLLAEWAGSAVLPFVFGFVDRVCERGRRRDVAGLAATYGLLVFTHLPLAVIGSLALVVYALVRIQGLSKIRQLVKLAFAAGLGLSVSAIYWVTMVSEIRWIGVNQIQRDASVDYRVNFLLSTFSPDNLNVWWMNILALMTLMLFAPALLLSRRCRSRLPVVVLTLFALFMSLPLSRPIWMLLKPLQETQFPWRWLVLISMAGSILAAAGLDEVSTVRGSVGLISRSDIPGDFDAITAHPTLPRTVLTSSRAKRMLVLGAMAISLAFTLSHVVREAQYFPPQRFESMVTDVRGSSCVNYWFPIWARSDVRKMTTEVEASGRSITVSSWNPEHRKFSIAAGPATEARVRTFYYPHWTATSEAGILATRPDKDGALLISLPQNATSIALDFREPRKTKISTMSSLSGLIIIGMLAAVQPEKKR